LPICWAGASGRAYVKISGAYRASKLAPDYADVMPLAGADRCESRAHVWARMAASELASGRRRRGNALFQIDDSRLLNQLRRGRPIRRSAADLVDNPARLYALSMADPSTPKAGAFPSARQHLQRRIRSGAAVARNREANRLAHEVHHSIQALGLSRGNSLSPRACGQHAARLQRRNAAAGRTGSFFDLQKEAASSRSSRARRSAPPGTNSLRLQGHFVDPPAPG